MTVIFNKNNIKCIGGRVTLPPSKSIAHRALICASFAKGESLISNMPDCDDIKATLRCLSALGAKIRLDGNCAYVCGIELSDITPDGVADCGESGSTLRFLIPFAAAGKSPVTFQCHGKLASRPLGEYEKIFKIQRDGDLLTVFPSSLPDRYLIDGSLSSQYSGGLIMSLAASGIGGSVTVENETSRPYNALTCEILGRFGVRAEQDGGTYKISGRTVGCHIEIPGDMSACTYFEMLNLLGADIEIIGKDGIFSQSDSGFCSNAEKIKAHGIVNVADCPDSAPALFALSAVFGFGEFTGTDRLKFKESDRLLCIKSELEKFGAEMEIKENYVKIISDGLKTPTAAIDSHGDHRIAMSMSVLLALTGGELSGGECVSKSYPGFFDVLESVGVKITN